MKLIFHLFLLILPVCAWGQTNPLVTVKGDNITIEQAFKIVESQSNYTVAFDRNKVNVTKKITINILNTTITTALDAILKNSGAQYRISGYHIFITPKPVVASVPVARPAPKPTPEVALNNEPEIVAPVAETAPVAAEKETRTKLLLKSNALHLFVPMLNAGVEFGVGNRFSIDVPVSYGGATWMDSNIKNCILFQPELRRWFGEPLHGHFAGIFMHISSTGYDEPFSDGNTLYGRKTRFGAGISYGYRVKLSKQWGLEATFGVGAAYVYAADAEGTLITGTVSGYDKVDPVVKAGITFYYKLK